MNYRGIKFRRSRVLLRSVPASRIFLPWLCKRIHPPQCRKRRRYQRRLAPRGLSRVAAAGYVGVSPNTFDRMVRDRLMPKAVRVYGRLLWDRRALDAAFDALSDADEEGRDDVWGHCAA